MTTSTNGDADLSLNNHGQDTLGAAAWASFDGLPLHDHNNRRNDWLIEDDLFYPAAIQYGHATETPQLEGTLAAMTTFGHVQQPWNALGQLPLLSMADMPANDYLNTSFPQLMSNTTPEQDRRNCLGCKGKEPVSCVRSPSSRICDTCVNDTGFDSPPSRIAESPFLFLDYDLWFTSCQELGRRLQGARPALTTIHRPDYSCCKYILELDFEDLQVRRNISSTYIYACDLHIDKVKQADEKRRSHVLLQTPPPPFNQEQFDSFVLTAMWRPLCAQRSPKKRRRSRAKRPPKAKRPAHANGQRRDTPKTKTPVEKVSDDEKNLFTKAQLLVGYYSLLRNLESIWTDETVPTRVMPAADRRVVLAELIYLFVYRFSCLIVEFSRLFPVLDDVLFEHESQSTARIRPGILLYALEILFLGVKSAGPPKWNLEQSQQTPCSHTLMRLQHDLVETHDFLLKNVGTYECQLVALYPGHHNLGVPGFVDVVRTAKAGLPKHLVVAIHPHIPSTIPPYPLFLFQPFPCLHDGYGLRSLVEILAVDTGDVGTAFLNDTLLNDDHDESWTPHQRFTEYWVDEDNSKTKCDWDNVECKERMDNTWTDVSIGYPHTATKGALPLLVGHPDPPQPPRFVSSASTLAGLHLGENDEHGEFSDTSWGTSLTATPGSQISEPGIAVIRDSQGQCRSETEQWDYRPQGVTVSRCKRKRSENNSDDGDSGSESTLSFKSYELSYSNHPFGGLLRPPPGSDADLRLFQQLREFRKKR